VNPPNELLPLIVQYRAGLEAEIALLRQLSALAARERETTASGELGPLDDITDARDRVMASLVSIESQLRPVRQTLAAARDRLRGVEAFDELRVLHDQAATLAEHIVSTDDHTRASLRDAELARRFASESLEKGESTLAAYRRVVAPELSQSALVDRKG
jgi:hypothetical protein